MLVRLITWPGRRIRYSSRPNSRTDSSTRWPALVTEWVAERERLDQVVVRAHVQPGDPVADPVAGRQHQHRRPAARLAEAPADLEAVQLRQHHVQHDDVLGVLRALEEAILAVAGGVDSVTLLLEPPPQRAGHLDFVLDDQHAHRPPPPRPSANPLKLPGHESVVRGRCGAGLIPVSLGACYMPFEDSLPR